MSNIAYQAKLVSIVINGVPVVGFQEEDMVEISRNNPSSTIVKGCKGETSRSLSNDKSGEIKLMLLQDSPSNKILKTLLKADELTGIGLGSVMIANLNDSSSYVGTDSSIKEPASVKLGKGLNGFEWIIQCGEIDFN